MKVFDWDKFKNEKIAVHCDTEEKAKDFFKQAIKQGLTWRDETPLKETNWKRYESDTSYIIYRDIFGEVEGLQFSPVQYYRDKKGYKITKWELDEMENLKDMLTAGRSVGLRNGDVCRIFTGVKGYSTIFVDFKSEEWTDTTNYSDNLTHVCEDNAFDIVKINERPPMGNLMTSETGKLLWQRQELTLEQKKIKELEAEIKKANEIIKNAKKELEKMEGVK